MLKAAISEKSAGACAFDALQERWPGDHAVCAHRSRIYVVAEGVRIASVLVGEGVSGELFVEEIISERAGSGGGRLALIVLSLTADEFGARVVLRAFATAQAAGGVPAMNTEQLRSWYERHGFVVQRGDARSGYVMERSPRGVAIKGEGGRDGTWY